MKVGVTGVSHVIVDNNVDTLDIDTSTEKVGSNNNSRLELLELLVLLDSAKFPLVVRCSMTRVTYGRKFSEFSQYSTSLPASFLCE